MRVASFVGVPFQDGGRDLERGADCVGLTAGILALAGMQAPDPGEHVRQVLESGAAMIGEFIPPGWRQIGFDDLRPLDVLYLRPGHHLALVAEDGWALETVVGRSSYLVPLRRLLPRAVSAWRPA